MARFRIFLAGSPHAPTIEVPVTDLSHLAEVATRSRFIEGEVVDCDDQEGPCRVLIPVNRIQMIAEAF